MINSAVRRSLLEQQNGRRRSSAAAPSILSRQIERICESTDSSDSDDSPDNDKTTAAISASLGGSRIHPEPQGDGNTGRQSSLRRLSISSSMRRHSSSIKFPIRHTIALKLKARDDPDVDDHGESDNEAETSDFNLPQYAKTSNHWRNTIFTDGGSVKGTFYIPNTKPWFIILPYNKYRTAWDVFMACILFILAFFIPFRVCFYFDDDASADRSAIFWIELAADALFGIDIVLNFLTAYGDPKTKRMIVEPKKIAKQYLRGFFFIDLVATFPFGLILSHPSLGLTTSVGKLGRLPKLLKFLRAAKLLKLVRLQQFITRLETEYNVHHGVTRMLKVISLVFLVTHVVGCFFYLIGLSGGSDIEDGGWMYRFDFDTKSIAANYVAALYWSFSSLTTVGYGDISARTIGEQVFSMCMMLVGVSWYAICVSSMSSIMATFDAESKALRSKMLSVNAFIRAGRFPPALAQKVRSYFEFRSSQRTFLMNNHYNADELLEELGSALRTDILLHLERDLISSIPFFDGKVPQFIADTISMLQPMVFQVGDLIVREGMQADEMYFLLRGRAAVLYGDTEALTIESGSYFGEIGCIMGGIRRASIKALTIVELQALSRRNLNILLAEYPEVAEELKGVAKYRAKAVKANDGRTDTSGGTVNNTSSEKTTSGVKAPSHEGTVGDVANGRERNDAPIADTTSTDTSSRSTTTTPSEATTATTGTNNERERQLDAKIDRLTSLVSQLERTIEQLNDNAGTAGSSISGGQ